MKLSLKTKFYNLIADIKMKNKIRKLGKSVDAKESKRLLKQIVNSCDSVFDVSQSIEKFGFRSEEERPLHLEKSLIMAVVNKTYHNGSVELSMYENEPSYPDKRVILLLYYNSKAGDLRVLEYGGTFTDKVSSGVKVRDKEKSLVSNGSKEKKANPTRMSKNM